MELPKGVHRVCSRGQEYFYYPTGRGTDHVGPRTRLLDDPQTPEFWVALRQALGVTGPILTDTVNALIDAYEASPAFTDPDMLSDGTHDFYHCSLRVARTAWGGLPSAKLRPVHVQAVMDGFAGTKGKANNFLGAMRALSAWASARGHIETSLTEGVRPYPAKGGHKPWTPAQISKVCEKLTGTLRRGVLLHV